MKNLLKAISVAKRRSLSVLLSTLPFLLTPAHAEQKSRETLMAVVREIPGTNQQEDVMRPMGKARAKLADGKEIEVDLAFWSFIGDLSVRFVFDGEQMMINATRADLENLGLNNVDDALALALSNLKRSYGEPVAKSWEKGLLEVSGKSPDFDSSYFLDREFWKAALAKHPEGVVVAVPKRGGLLYAPLSDVDAVDELKRGIADLYATSGQRRVSSALFLFRDSGWTVFQAPISHD